MTCVQVWTLSYFGSAAVKICQVSTKSKLYQQKNAQPQVTQQTKVQAGFRTQTAMYEDPDLSPTRGDVINLDMFHTLQTHQPKKRVYLF